MLDDTRFGEYQLGMAVRYSLATFHSAEMEREAVVTGTSSAFEQRLANAMMKEGIAYFGRLVMRVRRMVPALRTSFGLRSAPPVPSRPLGTHASAFGPILRLMRRDGSPCRAMGPYPRPTQALLSCAHCARKRWRIGSAATRPS